MLPPALALGALLADGGGFHRLAFWLVLAALPFAAAAAFVGVSDALEGKAGWLRGGAATTALTLLVLASAVRENAPRGAGVPTLAVTAVIAAVIAYGAPGLVWLLEPLRPRPRSRSARVRTTVTEP